jgi:hypothetical protein
MADANPYEAALQPEDSAKAAQLTEPSVKNLGEPQPLGFSDPVASVTDHTTRTLEPVLRDPKN